MRIATYNVEWFSSLFDDQNQLRRDTEWSARYNITRVQQLDAIAEVIRTIDPDCMLIVEAPDTGRTSSTVTSLLNFSSHYNLRQNAALTGFASETQQEIALLFDDRMVTALHDPVGGSGKYDPAPRFDQKIYIDIDVDDRPEPHVFSKPPLEVAIETASGNIFRLIGVHVKSKAPHGARNRAAEVRISIANRRKQLAQCLWLRRRIEDHLTAGDDIMVLGDFNDGPGLDEYEKLFGRSGVEIVLGAGNDPDVQLFDPHARARLDPRDAWSPSTARFYLRDSKRYLNALLDFIMISPGLRSKTGPRWKIWHPFDDLDCFENPDIQRALLTASDHFPVTLDLEL